MKVKLLSCLCLVWSVTSCATKDAQRADSTGELGTSGGSSAVPFPDDLGPADRAPWELSFPFETRDDGTVRAMEPGELARIDGEYAMYLKLQQPAYVYLVGLAAPQNKPPQQVLFPLAGQTRQLASGERVRIPAEGSWMRPKVDLFAWLIIVSKRPLPIDDRTNMSVLARAMKQLGNATMVPVSGLLRR